jgi:large subunit ribosomal protein L6
MTVKEGISIEEKEGLLLVFVEDGYKEMSAFHGLYRSLLNNMVIGVSEGFKKELELIGVGFRAAVKGQALDLQLGFSHPLLMDIPPTLEVEVEKNTKIVVSGSDKRLVGQFAADIRAKRKPEPYKGKGVRYVGEYVRKKAGKTGKAGK